MRLADRVEVHWALAWILVVVLGALAARACRGEDQIAPPQMARVIERVELSRDVRVTEHLESQPQPPRRDIARRKPAPKQQWSGCRLRVVVSQACVENPLKCL